jgi:hypothetical protein
MIAIFVKMCLSKQQMANIYDFEQNFKHYSSEIYNVAARTSPGYSKDVHRNDLLQKIYSCDEKEREKYFREE